MLDELAAAPKSLAMSIFNAVTKERCPIAVLPVSIVQALAKLYVEPLENDEVNRLMFAGFLGEEVGSWGWGRERCVCVWGEGGSAHTSWARGGGRCIYAHVCVCERERERECVRTPCPLVHVFRRPSSDPQETVTFRPTAV